MMNEELKPCPFCGSKNLETSYNDTIRRQDFRRGIYCCDCGGAISPYNETLEEAIRKWNTRYEPTSVCENCGREYKPTQPEQKYCCKSCKEIAHIKRSDPETAAILARIYGEAKVDA